MIVGNGLVAKSLMQYDEDDIIFFASGVSNSAINEASAFLRERNLLSEILTSNTEKHLVYFSTCMVSSIKLSPTPYAAHKLSMEKIVQESKNWTIFRLPNLVGRGGNPNNLVNFLKSNVVAKNRITIQQNAKRALLDADDMARLVRAYIDKGSNKCVIDLVLEQAISIFDILDALTKDLEDDAYFEIVPGGLEIGEKNEDAVQLARINEIDVSPGYSIRSLRKWTNSE